MVQHMRAARFLLGRAAEPLTVDIIMKAHEVLMAGAINEDGSPIKAGVLRAHAAHAGTHSYPEGVPAELHGALLRIVDAFNRSCASPDPEAFITAPVRLFYDVITLHPFENGNGRLCRLLFAYAVRRFGFPFSVPLSSGHRKARGHHMRAILQARRGHMAELHMMALMSMDAVLSNFTENVRLIDSR